MAYAKQREVIDVTVTESDLSDLSENGAFAVSHPNGGIILLVTADNFHVEHDSVIKRAPLLTGLSFDQLRNGEPLEYVDLSVRLESDD